MNIFRAGDLLPALRFLGGPYNFCNCIFFNVRVILVKKAQKAFLDGFGIF